MSSDNYTAGFFRGDSAQQQFYFIRVQGSTPNTYLIRHPGYAEGDYWYYEASQNYINLRNGEPHEFIIEPEGDGWVKIRHKNTGKFLYLTNLFSSDRLSLNTSGVRFRIISDVDWEIEDRGTMYNQPVMGSARATFAYSETLNNCSPATLETSVGNTQSRTTTWTYGTTESLQLFSSLETSAGFTVRSEVKAKIGSDAAGGSVEVAVGGEVRGDIKWTTSSTTTTSNTWSQQEQTMTEVSRIRTLTIPPFNRIQVYDAIKSIDNVRVPFTQVLRIRAKDRRNGDEPLSGNQIVTQLLSNLTTVVIKQVGNEFVDITLRGDVKMDRIWQAITDVVEHPAGCN